VGRLGAVLEPASMAGEVAWRWKSEAAELTKSGSAEMLPLLPEDEEQEPAKVVPEGLKTSLKRKMGD
jgi:hypothetical protein